MRSKKLIWVISLFALLLSGCDKKTQPGSTAPQESIVIAQLKNETTHLYYKGTLGPIKTNSVLSPADGTVSQLLFKYGDFVKKDQTLFVINSEKLADDYRDAVTKYLQAKDAYANGKTSFAGTEALHKAGVISNDEYQTSKSQYQTSIMNYYQAKFDLEKILAQANIDPNTIEKLTIVDTNAVNQILQRQFSNIIVRSPGDGVALFPVGNDSSSDGDKSGKLVDGAAVKQGQLLLSIGDLSGFSATVQVSEININKITPGLKAVVTGDAFPGMTLNGIVTSVANQANPDQSGSNSSLSLFNIVVEIPNITDAQRKVIHVGMTANIEISIQNPSRIILPISAVFQKNGQNFVTIVDPKTKARKDVPVVTGDTTITGVIIISGINAGDQVVVHD